MAITMESIKTLRAMTGAGLADVKKALTEADGDMDRAKEILRERGQAIAAKRGDRETSNGCVLVKAVDGFAAMIALKCETDFVANGADYIALTQEILDAAIAAKAKDLEAVKELTLANGLTVAAAITERETTLQEGIANYATAVTQGSSALREEFRNNRYSQQGGKSGGTGGSTKVTVLTDAQIAKNVADATEEMQRLIDQWIELDDRAGSVNDVLLILNSENSLTEFAEEADEGLDNLIARMTETQNATKRLTAEWNAMQAGFRNQAIDYTIGAVASLGDAIGGTTGSIIKLIAAQAQQVVQGISTIASMKAQEEAAYAEMTAELGAAAASTMKAHSWIPFVGVAMGIGFVASMVAALMSLPKFAGGGLVGGTSYSGDTQLASVNSGELILNKAQQNSLANELQSGNTQPLRLSARMSGTDILFAINNALASEGKGQLITLR